VVGSSVDKLASRRDVLQSALVNVFCPSLTLALPAAHPSPLPCRHPAPQVKTLTGKEIEIDIEPTDTVQRIKERVEEKEGIPPVQQRWVQCCAAAAGAGGAGGAIIRCWCVAGGPLSSCMHAPPPRPIAFATQELPAHFISPCPCARPPTPPGRLIFAGKAMNDDKMAKDYNIEVRGGLGRELDGGAWCGEVCVPKRSLGEVATCTAQG